MRAIDRIPVRGRAAIAAASLGALLALTACSAGTRDIRAGQPESAAPTTAPAAAPAPVAVSCEPTQRAIVRPTVVNGVAMSQVDCVSIAVPHAVSGATPRIQPQPVDAVTSLRAVPVDVADTEVVNAPIRRPAVRPAAARQIVYERPLPRRTVRKSALIIGSTAGAGAGLGAAIGGKKGALIGAAVGGAGATLWDQVTRRQD